jgi:D-alanine-D-alanine ligase
METQAIAMEGAVNRVRTSARTLDVTVLLGGPSSERDVSLVSGSAVADGLERAGHCVRRADISPSDTRALDVVFPVLHGPFGESGEVQELCERRGLRYVGSGPRASWLGMDKVTAKEIFRQAGLATPDWVVVQEADSTVGGPADLAGIGLPCVLKPVDGGSSVDVTIARNVAARNEALDDLLGRYSRALVEAFIAGREFTVGILGEQALPVLEIIPAREFYDKIAKYQDGAGTRYVFDHGLAPQAARAMQEAALTAHRSLGCRDMSRVDFILDDQGVPYVLELNTIPGFTSHSLLPMAAKQAGIGFDQLVDRLVTMAMER